jgi:hypothetical protein
MQFPITVEDITFDGDPEPITPTRLCGAPAGAWVAVRPVKDNPENKTYLGVMLGDYQPPSVRFDRESGMLIIGKGVGNPAMWVPDLKRVVMGWGSWWRKMESETDLRQISDADIENVWYVRALKDLAAEK